MKEFIQMIVDGANVNLTVVGPTKEIQDFGAWLNQFRNQCGKIGRIRVNYINRPDNSEALMMSISGELPLGQRMELARKLSDLGPPLTITGTENGA